MALAALALYGGATFLMGVPYSLLVGLVCIGVYAAYAYAWMWMVYGEAGEPLGRQWVAAILDQVVFGVCFAFAGKALIALAWVPVTTSVGHGLRFGERRGTASAAVGALAVFAAVSEGVAWHEPLSTAIGMAASTLIVPLYVVRLVRTMASQRRVAETQAKVLAETVRTDALTGALSRTGFAEHVRILQDAGKTTGESVGFVFLDLDGFKALNDAKGHDVGDIMLREVAQALSRAVRTSDAISRHGGDEFVIVVKAPPSIDAVSRVAENAVEAIRRVTHEAAGDMKLDASAGISVLEPAGLLANALQEADARMFEVKRERKVRRRRELGEQLAVAATGGAQ